MTDIKKEDFYGKSVEDLEKPRREKENIEMNIALDDMSDIKEETIKGKWHLNIIASTKQWSIKQWYGGEKGMIHGGDSHNQEEEVRDLIDLLEAYLILRKSNYDHE